MVNTTVKTMVNTMMNTMADIDTTVRPAWAAMESGGYGKTGADSAHKGGKLANKNEQSLEENPTPMADSVDDVGPDGDGVNSAIETGADGATKTIMAGDSTATDYSLAGVDNPILRSALRLARKGIPVFPQYSSVDEATTDSAVIHGWWEEDPYINLMIETGAESGVFVVLVEGMEGGRYLNWLESKYGYLRTHRVIDPSGGRHLFFRHPGGRVANRKNLLRGISILGDGGYVMVPPSSVYGGEYRWETWRVNGVKMPTPDAPDHLLEMISWGIVKRSGSRPPRNKRPVQISAKPQPLGESQTPPIRRGPGRGSAPVSAEPRPLGESQTPPIRRVFRRRPPPVNCIPVGAKAVSVDTDLTDKDLEKNQDNVVGGLE